MKKTTIYKGFYYKFSFKSVYFLDPFFGDYQKSASI